MDVVLDVHMKDGYHVVNMVVRHFVNTVDIYVNFGVQHNVFTKNGFITLANMVVVLVVSIKDGFVLVHIIVHLCVSILHKLLFVNIPLLASINHFNVNLYFLK
jgi:hypothetical protein